MEEAVIDKIILNSKKQIKWVDQFKKTRYLFQEVKRIDKEYYVGIKGIRGIGKTVLLLQFAKKEKDSVYFSADSTLIRSFSIYEVVEGLIKRGFRNIFIDEIHRKADWDLDLKTLYDEHEVRIIFTGSSALDITKTGSDLSRRVVLKELKIASFREYLNIKKNYDIQAVPFEKILKNKTSLVKKYPEIYEYFDEYLTYGGVLYPKNGFFEALENSLRKVILQDLVSLRNINIKYETDVYKLLYLIARSSPFEVNYSSISRKLEISKTMAVRIVKDMETAGIVLPVLPCKKKGIDVKKEPKIYLTLPLRKFFAKQGVEINKGAVREEFFVNHIRDVCYLKGKRGEKTPDFRFKNITIEIGGETKTKYQKPDYIAIDGLSTVSNKVPLFLFGLIY
ncbi:MAG: ATP-binding protein [Thermoplasmata archaeon]|nr:MAG: ATP-binding protein [Thermoplasmata archaeon]